MFVIVKPLFGFPTALMYVFMSHCRFSLLNWWEFSSRFRLLHAISVAQWEDSLCVRWPWCVCLVFVGPRSLVVSLSLLVAKCKSGGGFAGRLVSWFLFLVSGCLVVFLPPILLYS